MVKGHSDSVRSFIHSFVHLFIHCNMKYISYAFVFVLLYMGGWPKNNTKQRTQKDNNKNLTLKKH